MIRRCLLLALVGFACKSQSPGPDPSSAPAPGEPLRFAFGTIDGEVLSSENTRGRVTTILFLTTFDLSSQVAARHLEGAFRSHKPKFNALAVVLETAENRVLADVFRRTMRLDYPVAIADRVELRSSAFRQIDRVPTLVVLDRAGRERVRKSGVFEASELERWLEQAD